MKLLTQVSEIGEYHRLKLLFESKGILLHVGNEETARNYGVFHPAGRYALYVMIEEQYQDAKKLLENSEHIVQNPVDIEQISHIKDKQNLDSMGIILNNITTMILGLFGIVLVVWWFINATGS